MLGLILAGCSLQAPLAPRSGAIAAARVPAVGMDETMLEKALAGELADEGQANPYMSEVGWADYLDKNGQQSYNMNQRPSLAKDGYYTASVMKSPFAVVTDWAFGLKGFISDPLGTAFPTISNDPTGGRSFGPGVNEVNARTIKPKTKDFDPSMRITGIPGYNLFGVPGSKKNGAGGLPGGSLFGAPPRDEPKGDSSKPKGGLFGTGFGAPPPPPPPAKATSFLEGLFGGRGE